MIFYAIAKPSSATSQLARLLEARGIALAPAVDTADVLLLGADSAADMSDELAKLGIAARKSLVVGALPSISVTRRAEPGTLEGALETFRPLGVLNVGASDLIQEIPGFVGPKHLAERLGAGFMKAFSTKHYGTWIRRDGLDVADFILRLVTANAA